MTTGSTWTDPIRLDDPQFLQDGYYAGDIAVLDAEFTTAQPAGGPPTGTGVRPAFFTLVPHSDMFAVLRFRTFGTNDEGPVFATLYEQVGSDFVLVEDQSTGDTDMAVFQIDLAEASTYLIVARFRNETVAQQRGTYLWTAEIPEPVGPRQTVQVPPIAVTAVMTSGSGTGPDPDPDPDPEPTWAGTVVLSSPDDEAVVATAQPNFTVGVDPPGENDDYRYTVEIQYGSDPELASPTTQTATARTADGGVIVAASTALSGTVYWRARVVVDAEHSSAWTAIKSFTVSLDITATVIPVTWTVDPVRKPPIHLWHFYPAGPSVGDTVTIYGQGFPAAADGHVFFGDTTLTPLSWQRVPATSGGTIAGDNVTAEHWEITFTAPNYQGPGEVLTVSDEPVLEAS